MTPERFQEIQELFHAALEKRSDERKAFLSSACAGDGVLEAEVWSLLEHHGGAGPVDRAFKSIPSLAGLLANADMLAEVAGGAAVWPDAVEGSWIGPYRIVRELGSGGMGTVYLGQRDDEQFHQQVAIKLLQGAVASDDFVRRFRVERQILASIDHPNIARLLDGGTTPGGMPYAVMEFVDGQPLDTYCRSHTLRVAEIIQLFRTVCLAVQAVNENRIIHRDLKPGNILVTPDGEPKLLDFGIAKLLEHDGSTTSAEVTRVQGPLMTPEYASPEQIRGERLSTRSDVYSLGVLLYMILSGTPPFSAKGGTLPELHRMICEDEPTRPSSVVSDPSVRRQLRGDLDTIVLTALRKAPALRYASAAHLSEDLLRHLEHRPVVARPDSHRYRAIRFVRRNRASMSVAAGLVMVLVGATVVSLTERAQAERQAERASSVSSFLERVLSSPQPRDGLGRSVTVLESLEWLEREVAVTFAADPQVEADVRSTLGATYSGLADYDRALSQTDRALAIRRSMHGEPHLDVATSLSQRGKILYQTSDYENATADLLESLAIQDALADRDDLTYVDTLKQLGFVLQDVGRLADAERRLRQARELAVDAVGSDHPVFGDLTSALANVRRDQGDLAEAEQLHRQALALRRRVHGSSHPDVADSLGWLGGLLADTERHDEALVMLQPALSLNRALMGERHPATARTLHFVGRSLLHLGRPREAADRLREALDIFASLFGERHRLTAGVRTSYGESLIQLEQHDAADHELGVAQRMLTELLGADHVATRRAVAARQRLASIRREASDTTPR